MNEVEFKDKLIRHFVQCEIYQWLAEHEPKGEYDPEALIPLDGGRETYKKLSLASREDLTK